MRTTVWLAALVLVACGDDDVAPADAGRDRDGTVIVDDAFVPDAAASDAASDAGRADAAADAAPAACPGACRADMGRCAVGVCVLTAAEPMCATVGGMMPLDSPCETTDQCVAGLACFRDREGGVCRRICCPEEPSSCGVEERCGGTGILVDGTATSYGECWPPRPCTLFLADMCLAGESCFLLDAGETDCRVAGTAIVGESCAEANDCEAGLSCVGAFGRTCARVCRLAASDGCPADEGVCRAYADSPEGTGICTPR